MMIYLMLLIGIFIGFIIGFPITYLFLTIKNKKIKKLHDRMVEKWANYDIDKILKIKRIAYPNVICDELINNAPLVEDDYKK